MASVGLAYLKKYRKFAPMEVDIVYLWVDGSDPAWQAKRNEALGRKGEGGYMQQAVAEGRFVQSDELRYSLRSLAMYAPWIRRIHILTDGQCPSWLNTDNPKIHLVSHAEVMAPELLPTFNSTAIEMHLAQIPSLADHFLFANDDMFFGRAVGKEFFFDAEGRAIARMVPVHYNPRKAKHRNNIYRTHVYRSSRLVAEATGHKIAYQPHHNIDAYRKEDVVAALERWPELAEESRHNKFRKPTGLHRTAFLFYAVAQGRAKMKIVGHTDGEPNGLKRLWRSLTGRWLTDSKRIGIERKDFTQRIAKYNPALYCLNDGEKSSAEDRERMAAYLQERYPEKCEFER